jgi:hypothetical protein
MRMSGFAGAGRRRAEIQGVFSFELFFLTITVEPGQPGKKSSEQVNRPREMSLAPKLSIGHGP